MDSDVLFSELVNLLSFEDCVYFKLLVNLSGKNVVISILECVRPSIFNYGYLPSCIVVLT